MTRLRHLLSRPVSIMDVIETAMWLAVPYLVIGTVWAFAHYDRVQQIETAWAKVLPAGADLAAYGQVALLWPAILLLPTDCSF